MKFSAPHSLETRNLWTGRVLVEANYPVADDTWRVGFFAPELIQRLTPGQFVMLRLPDVADPLLGRPFAVYSTDAATGRVEVIYLVVGKMTRRLTAVRAGEMLELTGPLGNGWDVLDGGITPEVLDMSKKPLPTESPTAIEQLIMVAGGIGQTPFLLLAQKWLARPKMPKITLIYGAKTASRLVPLDDFTRLGVETIVVTEDGSAGRAGLVTDALSEKLDSFVGLSQATTLCACGPKRMLAAVFAEAKFRGLPCWTSLESPMSCGLGICFGCVVEYREEDGNWDYRRTCLDGPVFDAWRLRWDAP